MSYEPVLPNHSGRVCRSLHSRWDTLELDVRITVEVDHLEVAFPGEGHKGPDIKAWYVIAKAPGEDVLVRVKLVMVVPKVVADLVAKDWSGSGTASDAQADHAVGEVPVCDLRRFQTSWHEPNQRHRSPQGVP